MGEFSIVHMKQSSAAVVISTQVCWQHHSSVARCVCVGGVEAEQKDTPAAEPRQWMHTCMHVQLLQRLSLNSSTSTTFF